MANEIFTFFVCLPLIFKYIKDMASFLYTWNPEYWNWLDFQDAVYRVNNKKQYDIRWSCGKTKRINTGDLFFLMRLGIEPKGIIGCGYITSKPYFFTHWDKEKAKEGKETLRTDLAFKSLSEEPIFSITYLKKNYPTYNWTPQTSGLSIPDGISAQLFLLLQRQSKFAFVPANKEEVQTYAEGKVKKVTVTTYDRSSIARQICIEHYGYNCAVCNFNFGKAYGKLGEKYIEVHHLKQLADISTECEINPIDDLRPVCANCHRMLHKERPPLSIDELKAKIST